MKRYNPKDLEPKWQQQWAADKIYEASEETGKAKKYILEYFPYPSGAAMHVGHVRNYTIGDVVARYDRMNGYNVLHPMGWDSFGLPAENYAIKHNISPAKAISENTTKFKQQLTQMGFSYDWSREINSSDPEYYRWTQWFFSLLFQRGLAYRKESLVNWDPIDKTVLANEQVVNGIADRSGAKVQKIPLAQWFFKITDYADRLAEDLDGLNWTDSIKSMQRNWIGKSKGTSVEFEIDGHKEKIKVFTTAHDTIYGVTFMVLAPEHPLVNKISSDEHQANVKSYVKMTQGKSDIERQDTSREKTGVFTGAYAINPLNGAKVPVWIADYVLVDYGTGAVMAVPGEDARDYEFAQKYSLPIIYTTHKQEFVDYQKEVKNNRKHYKLANSEEFNGLDFEVGRQKILEKIVKLNVGQEHVQYKIRDWLISRQRYWGAPIPIIWVEKSKLKDTGLDEIQSSLEQDQTKFVDGKELIAVPVTSSQLPVVLPQVDSYQPDGSGKGPLARAEDWVHVWLNVKTGVTKPFKGNEAADGWVEGWRETDTMDGFACSSWYFLRFADPDNKDSAFDPKKIKYWLPVDDYIGGAEHAVMHLLYARMWTKVMFDAGLINFDEPFKTLRNQGMILAPDGRKMSKSWGNVIAPDEIIDQGYGADSIRIMELFIGPWNQTAAWSIEGMGGCFRFLQRVWTLTQEFLESKDSKTGDVKPLQVATNKAIDKVSKDLHEMGFNTAIATLMDLTNQFYKIKAADGFANRAVWQSSLESLLQVLAPFAPHISEELWQQLGHKNSIHISEWPQADAKYLASDTVTIVVQVNGKLRAQLLMPAGSDQAAVEEAAKANAKVADYLKDKQITKTIFVADKLISFVVR